MESKPLVRLFQRLLFCVVLVVIIGGVGGFCVLTATNPKIPHPWGQVRMMHYSTNNLTPHAHFRFKNLFIWPVLTEVAVEIQTDRGWELARGYSMFVPLENEVGAGSGRDFSVPVPFDCKAWRVLVRAYKARPTKMEMHRVTAKDWLASRGVHSLSDRIQVEDPDGYILPGPEMKYEKPGELPTPQYNGYVGPSKPVPATYRKGTIRTCPR